MMYRTCRGCGAEANPGPFRCARCLDQDADAAHWPFEKLLHRIRHDPVAYAAYTLGKQEGLKLLQPTRPEGESAGASLIASERRRQVAEEGYDAEHDDGHGDAMILSVASEILSSLDPSVSIDPEDPWGLIARHSRKEHGEERLLVIAGALIAAEIDRRIRARPDNPNREGGQADG